MMSIRLQLKMSVGIPFACRVDAPILVPPEAPPGVDTEP
jgi:hypothetical protein